MLQIVDTLKGGTKKLTDSHFMCANKQLLEVPLSLSTAVGAYTSSRTNKSAYAMHANCVMQIVGHVMDYFANGCKPVQP